MRFSHIAVVYFIMAAMVYGGGVVPASELGLVEQFVEIEDDGAVSANETQISGAEEDGGVNNLMGPVKDSLDTITGGALLAVWGFLSKLFGAYAWPITVTNHIGAPQIVVIMSGVLVMSFTLGLLRVVKRSI